MLSAALLSAAVAADAGMVGYWNWNWGPGSKGPAGANAAISFTGLIDPNAALTQGRPAAKGMRNLISLGGGNAGGMFTASALAAITPEWLAKAKAAGFDGVAYDIEVCSGTVAPQAFLDSFGVVKKAGLEVLVTVSHTAPYDCTNKVALMHAFIPSPQIDYLSPQLYSSGTEGAPSFDWDGVPFSAFAHIPASMQMVPSIVDAAQYAAVEAFYKKNGLRVDGFIQWRQQPAGAEAATASASASAAAAEPAKANGPTIAYWAWTWSSGDHGPPGANLAISFSGWADLQKALDQSRVHPGIPTLLDVGGGNANGRWSQATLDGMDGAFLAKVKAAGYAGVAFDIEECSGVIAPAAFQKVFAAMKAEGLKVLVTSSHSQPYGCSNAADLMAAFIADPNVDYMSPQLYTSGNEAHPDFTAVGTQWADYLKKPATQQFIPSIPNYLQYQETADYFKRFNLPVDGLVQWQQNTTAAY